MKVLANVKFTAHIGIDWADTKHDICIQPANSDERVDLHRNLTQVLHPNMIRFT